MSLITIAIIAILLLLLGGGLTPFGRNSYPTYATSGLGGILLIVLLLWILKII
jgi:hypothetical protein